MDDAGSILVLGDRTVDLGRRTIDGPHPTQLTELEAAVLSYLSRHATRVVPRDELLIEVWGWQPGMTTRSIDTIVYRIRQKLEDNPKEPTRLISQYGGGYRVEGFRLRADAVDIACVVQPISGDPGPLEGSPCTQQVASIMSPVPTGEQRLATRSASFVASVRPWKGDDTIFGSEAYTSWYREFL